MSRQLQRFQKTDVAYFKCPCGQTMRARIKWPSESLVGPSLMDNPVCPSCKAVISMGHEIANSSEVRKWAEKHPADFEFEFPMVEV
jgi:hypothetical protein